MPERVVKMNQNRPTHHDRRSVVPNVELRTLCTGEFLVHVLISLRNRTNSRLIARRMYVCTIFELDLGIEKQSSERN